MENKLKRFLSLALALLMVFSLMPQVTIGAKAASDTKTIYLNAGGSSLWDQGGAWFAAWVWGSNSNGTWHTFSDNDADGIYEISVPSDSTGMKVNRMAKGATAPSWTQGDSGYWNQTSNLDISSYNYCTITDWNKGIMSSKTVTAPTYYVAGVQGLTGADWDPAQNQMSDADDDGTYEITFTGIAAGTYEYKVAVNGSWSVSWGKDGGSANASVTTTYTKSSVTVKFTPATKALTATVACDHETEDGESAWSNGVCGVCGATCSHDWSKKDGVCTVCNYECSHSSHATNGNCDTCEKYVYHNYPAENNYKCSCGLQAVAKDSNNTYYTDLQTPLTSGGNITLLWDVNLGNDSLTVEGNVVLDLAGHTITSNNANVSTITVETTGNLTIVDSGATGSISNESGTELVNKGTATLKGGTVGYSVDDLAIVNYGTLTTEDAVTINGEIDDTTIVKVAKIGEDSFSSLQAAINAVKQNGQTVELLCDVTEASVTIDTNVAFTIDGKGYDFTGKFKLGTGEEVTIQNVDFVASTDISPDYFIDSFAKNSNCKLKVLDCTFTDTDYSTVAVGTHQPTSVLIQGCTATGVHSLLQNQGGYNITVKETTVTGARGMSLGTVQGATLEKVTVNANADKYGIRLDAGASTTVTIKGCTVNAGIPVVIREKDGKSANNDYNVVFENNTLNNNNNVEWLCVAGEGEYDPEKNELPSVSQARIIITLNENSGLIADTLYNCEENYGDNVYYSRGTQAAIGTTYYDTLAAAIEAANATEGGATVKVLADCSLSDDVTINGNVTITADNAVTITANVTDAFTVVANGSLTLGSKITVNSDTAPLYANGGTIVIDGATVTSTSDEYALATVDNNGTMTVKGGAIISENENAVAVNGGTLNLLGGTVTTNNTKDSWPAVYAFNNGVINLTGSTVNGDVSVSNNGVVKISGGTVNGELYRYWASTTGSMSVSGGTFTNAVPTEFCAEGLVPTEADSNGKYTVKAAEVILNAIEGAYGSEIQFWMYVTLRGDYADDENAYVVITKEGGYGDNVVKTVKFSNLEKDASGRYKLVMGIASGEMTNKIHYQFFNGNGEAQQIVTASDVKWGTKATYSFADYVNNVMRGTDADQKKIVTAVATYGGYAQIYFSKQGATNVNPDNPIYNELNKYDGYKVLSLEGVTADSIAKSSTVVDGSIGIKATSMQTFADSAMYLRVYFTLDEGYSIGSYSFKLGNEPVTASADANGRYYVDIPVPAAYMDKEYTITVTNGTGTYSITTSVLVWIKNVLKSSSDADQINLVKAAYLYNQAANEFFGE